MLRRLSGIWTGLRQAIRHLCRGDRCLPMLSEDLSALEEAFPEIFQRETLPKLPNDVVIITDDNVVISDDGEIYVPGIWNKIDKSFDSEHDLEQTDSPYALPDIMSEQQLNAYCEDIENGSFIGDRAPYDAILQTFTSINGPIDEPTGTDSSHVSVSVSPDVLAFYRPWHYYASPDYGIYLFHDSVTWIASVIKATSRNLLTVRDSITVAKAFLFHHEQYHNKVEAFATRLEVSHRVPCYKAGFEAIWQADLRAGAVEEEGLATAYAAEIIRTALFEGDRLAVRKRRIATSVVICLIRTMFSPRCSTALPLVRNPAAFERAEEAFQERNAVRSLSIKLTTITSVWNAFGYSMAPTISRNKSFSYVISRNSAAARLALDVRHFGAAVRRTDLVRTLTYVLRGQIRRRGKEPIFFASNGSSAPIPGHQWVKEGTANSVTSMLGIPLKARELLRLSKAELRELRDRHSAS